MRTSKNSSKGRGQTSGESTANEDEYRQMSTDSEQGHQRQSRSGDDEEEIAAHQRGEAVSSQGTADSEAESGRRKGGSAGLQVEAEDSASGADGPEQDLSHTPEGDAPGGHEVLISGQTRGSSSSSRVRVAQNFTDAPVGDALEIQEVPASGRAHKDLAPKKSVTSSARSLGGKSSAGAKIGMAALMAASAKGGGVSRTLLHSSSGGGTARSSATPAALPTRPLHSVTQGQEVPFMQVAMTAAQLSDYNAWLQQRAVPQHLSSKKGAAVTFSAVPAATFSSHTSTSTAHLSQVGAECILVEDSEEDESHAERELLIKGNEKKGGAPASPRRSADRLDSKKEENRAASPKRLQQSSPKTTLLSPKKRPVTTPALPRCPRCGDTAEHDWVSCKKMMANFPRSTAENVFLRSLSQLQRMAGAAKRSQAREAMEDSAEEGEDIEEDSSEEEDQDEAEQEEEDDEDEDGMDADEDDEVDEEASYFTSTSSRSRSSTSSDPTYQPSTSVDSRDTHSAKTQRLSRKSSDRMARMEQALEQLTSVMSSFVRRDMPRGGVTPDRDNRSDRRRSDKSDHKEGGRAGREVRGRGESRHLSSVEEPAEVHRSVLTDPKGMEGCPEMQRDDLLQLSKFEDFERRYKEYVDKASDRRRTYHRMVHGFRKFSFELRQYIKSLLNKSHTLREAYETALPSFDLTDEEFLLLNNVTFGRLYREVCTHHSCLPSQVLQKLEKTSFPRGRTGDDCTLPALVVRASAAFREKLKEQPRHTIRQCTDKQLKESFIRMLLGPEERNLADFPSATTWEEVLSELLELDGTSQADTLLRKIQAHSKTETVDREVQDAKPRQNSQGSSGGAAVRPKQKSAGPAEEHDDSAWQQQFEKLAAEFKPTAADMQDCNTYQQKVKRILTIRDTRKRESEMKEMRAALPPSTSTKPVSSMSVSRSQLAEDTPTCFHCKEKGHYKRDCPKRKAAHRDTDEE